MLFSCVKVDCTTKGREKSIFLRKESINQSRMCCKEAETDQNVEKQFS